ncbi:type II secretion system protein [Polynucleobacter arcticus]|uniref:type II secretion system protein n=1 Tax=Polynucleobacter arcticus TaxID=1743165 RepID=UPI00156D74C2|nr:type II secretion system protein [Polynucleobacter arcticus]
MPQFCRVNPESLSALRPSRQVNGFILLEVLVALSLVAGSWVALGSTYQGIILRLGQLQATRDAITTEWDRHEMAVLNTAQLSSTTSPLRKSSNELAGMSRRSRPLSHSRSASDKK